MTWGDQLAAWWISEVAGDPAYAEQVIPLALDLIDPTPGERWLDLGCGEGRVMRLLEDRGAIAVGCDLSATLATLAGEEGRAVVARLPDLGWLRDDAVDGACAVLVLEHLEDLPALFAACGRVVRPGGRLVAVLNHPVMTAPGSAPVYDPDDEEILWRWGDYFGSGATHEPAGEGEVVFHHRSLAALLDAASGAGWLLGRLVEQGVGERQADRDPLLAMQRNIPRLLGVVWQRRG
ncbi:MAG: class I SAM-dependent methyltransferase [Acidimicrobiia bacterium]|nr:class I SAM-dependent methyltransferase [Acidimicrobiia bacterium]